MFNQLRMQGCSLGPCRSWSFMRNMWTVPFHFCWTELSFVKQTGGLAAQWSGCASLQPEVLFSLFLSKNSPSWTQNTLPVGTHARTQTAILKLSNREGSSWKCWHHTHPQYYKNKFTSTVPNRNWCTSSLSHAHTNTHIHTQHCFIYIKYTNPWLAVFYPCCLTCVYLSDLLIPGGLC